MVGEAKLSLGLVGAYWFGILCVLESIIAPAIATAVGAGACLLGLLACRRTVCRRDQDQLVVRWYLAWIVPVRAVAIAASAAELRVASVTNASDEDGDRLRIDWGVRLVVSDMATSNEYWVATGYRNFVPAQRVCNAMKVQLF